MRELRGKRALVTGASRGLGSYIAHELASAGVHLVLAARSEEPLQALARQLREHSVSVDVFVADVTSSANLRELATFVTRTGGVDILINNAGVHEPADFASLAPEKIEAMIAANLAAPMLLTRYLLPHMQERPWGHIVNMASLGGLLAAPYQECYIATKHGLVGFSRSLRYTLRDQKHDVGVTEFCPGLVAEVGVFVDAVAGRDIEAPPLLGTVTPEKVASAVVRAIRLKQDQVVLTSRPVRPALFAQLVSPRWAEWLVRQSGTHALYRRIAARTTPSTTR